ncbi:competence protein CoiA family protein [Cetobacterium sp.]|uniref:competence protein CoiA family protein n=1 Tax=Cetobacterium sp. TaxID=2071632 RepID=UPI003EE672F8
MFALNSNNKIIHIKNALGKIDYYCANCKGILRVRNGKIKIKHFYHLAKDCGDRGESLIHRYWKEYFLTVKEFENYNIVDSRTEVSLLNGNYIPDIVLKTDKETYIIIEICYKNPKTSEYFEKYKKLSKLEKVFEIKVDFNEIIETKILYDKFELKNLYEELQIAKNYLINYSKDGGIVHRQDMYHPIEIYLSLHKDMKMAYRWSYNPEVKKKYKYPYKNSIVRTKVKIYLSVNTELYGNLITSPFYVNIYNERELEGSAYNGQLGWLCIKTLESQKEIIVCVNVLDKKYCWDIK